MNYRQLLNEAAVKTSRRVEPKRRPNVAKLRKLWLAANQAGERATASALAECVNLVAGGKISPRPYASLTIVEEDRRT